ncbi:SNF2-related protein [Faecalispora sporosphaeroides]
MQSKIQSYFQLSEQTLQNVCSSKRNWTSFLSTIAQLYKYSFDEQLLIYAQRPEATACADFKLWNETMHRYIRRGAKGIALIDASGDKPKIRYVFDISDTISRHHSHPFLLWGYRSEHEEMVRDSLIHEFKIPDKINFTEFIEKVAGQVVEEYWQEYRTDLLQIIDDNVEEGYNRDQYKSSFRNIAAASVSYVILSRCSLNPVDYFEGNENWSIFDSITPEISTALGTVLSNASEKILRQIETTIKVYDRNLISERSATHGEQSEIQPERGLSDSQLGNHRASREPWQIRENAKELPERASSGVVQQSTSERETVSAPLGDRSNSDGANGTYDARTDEVRGRDREYESIQSDALGRTDEQLEGASRGNDPDGAYSQLSFFPTVQEQIQRIDEAESNQLSAFSMSIYPSSQHHNISQADIDSVLQEWNGDIKSKHAVVRYMQVHPHNKDATAFLRAEFGDNLPAFPVTMGNSITDLSWAKVKRRIAQLIQDDRFYTQEEYDNYDSIDPVAIRERLAQSGIVDGRIVDEEKLNLDPFIRQVTSDVERISQQKHAEFPDLSGQTIIRNGDTITIGDTESAHEIEVTIPDKEWKLIEQSIPNSSSTCNHLVPNQQTTDQVVGRDLIEKSIPRDDRDDALITSEQAPLKNFRITDDHLGNGGAKTKYRNNLAAIRTLRAIEAEGRAATSEEQEILSRYVGWGGIPQAFDSNNPNWTKEFIELHNILHREEYESARASTLNAHYTSPTVIKAIYEAVGNMGFETGNILEPACGVGNFFGLLPEEMAASNLYGVELDSITGRIANQLYPDANITIAGFETTDRRDFFDLAVGNVPFGNYKVIDRAYDKLGFPIHDYFFAKTLDQVRPGGLIVFITSHYTMDKKSPEVRRYIAQRAELLGAIRLPSSAFKANAGTEVSTDILFLQKRNRPLDIDTDWIHLGLTQDNIPVNSYFADHPEMVLGTIKWDNKMYGDKKETTCEPIPDSNLTEQLHVAVSYIQGKITEAELPELSESTEADDSIPANPDVKNYSYTIVKGNVYYRENSLMVRPNLNETAKERICGMVELRNCVYQLINLQLDEHATDDEILKKQAELNQLYDAFYAQHGLINDRSNRLAFSDDSSYYLLCSLEILDDDGHLKRKADMFTKRTIKQHTVVTSVDTASEALAVSIGERAKVDLPFMAELSGKTEEQVISDLTGVIFKDPVKEIWQTSDEYLSGNVRQKLREAHREADRDPAFKVNVEALEKAQPRNLDASEIGVRLGATWIDKAYIQQFMEETFNIPFYLRNNIQVKYVEYTAEWRITSKTQISHNDVAAYTTYGTDRANAYRILEDSLNLRDVRIYDTVEDADGKERRVLNSKETTLASQKQQAIRDAFRDWIWKDPERRQALVYQYNEVMNSTRPREYDGSHITFSGMNPEITLRKHQKNAVAHVLYGGNTMLAHEVGAGKTFEMVAACMESKRLGLSQKSIFVVPNHLTEQWASEFLRLYPSANLLVTKKKDFETHNRKKFCARIVTGDYDAVIIGHTQFEKIPISPERQKQLLQDQIFEITEGISEVQASGGEQFTIKQLERTRKGLEARLQKLQADNRKDDVISFEQLGCDRMFVDESDNYKNLFLYTKMRNVAGLSTTDAQKSSDMFSKCRYMDELTGNRGVIFATGTPISNSMTELYTIHRYLQYDRLKELHMMHFDCWASRFGETTTALELAPEGTGYRARTRFAKFFNLPELMNLFKEVADIKTADQLNLPTPEVEYHTFVSRPTEHQKEIVQTLSERATEVHFGNVDPSIDNMLKITSDGRKLGLDQRIINDMLPDEPETKVNSCVDNIIHFWREGQADKLTQLVFCDISTPKATPAKQLREIANTSQDNPELHALEISIPLPKPEPAFNVYDDIKKKLVTKSIPIEQIAFIHDAKTDIQKKELFGKVRSGQVRILIGSTAKMGAGTNVQDRLIAIHDLDCPWRPRDLIQRQGRIVRQGNMNKKVHICRYVTEGTFDAYLWQTVENKQKFISQIMSSKSPVRSCEDVDEAALSFAEIKALCAGDPRIKERMDLDVEVSRLKIMKADHQSKHFRMEDYLLKHFPEQIKQNQGLIQGLKADMNTLTAHPHPKDSFAGMEVQGCVMSDKENAGNALLDICKEIKGRDPVQIGSYRGFTMLLSYDAFENAYTLVLKGNITHRAVLGKDSRGNIIRIDNVLSDMPKRLQEAQLQLDNLNAQVEATQLEVDKPFPQEEALRAKSVRLIELNSLLALDTRSNTDSYFSPQNNSIREEANPSNLSSRLNRAEKETASSTMISKQRETERI